MDNIEFLYEGNNPMLQTMLEAASSHWDISQSDLIENMLKIGFHESAGTFDPSIKQIKGGPGVGIYQYEKDRPGVYNEEGKEFINQGASTAINRLIAINDIDNNINLWDKEDGQPGWINDLINNNYDVGQLTSEQQHLIFLADKMRDPTASFKGVNTDKKLAVEWADEHQAGTKPGTPERKAILNKFKKDMPEFEKYLNKLPLEIMIP
jgi:hypothetical protein